MATVTILKIRILSDSPAPEIQNIELNALAAAAGTQSSTNWKSKAWLWNTTFGSKWKYFSMDIQFIWGIPKIVFISLRFSMTEAESQNYQNSLQTDIVILDSIMDTRRHVDTRIRGDRAPSKSSELQDC